MKDISDLPECLNKLGSVLDNHLIEAQSQAADLMWQDAYANARRHTGAYALSIYRTPTEKVGNDIQTFIGSDMQVISSSGKSYNLGELLEHGTSPHLIEPVNSKYLVFEINGEKIYTKRVNHPGTKAYNTYYNAKVNNIPEYQQLLINAVKDAFKEAFK